MRTIPIVAALLICTAAHAGEPALNPVVTEATINETICTPHYAAKVRLPWYTMARIKLALLKARGETWLDAPKYELDHIVPLCLGGASGDLSNLQLQPWNEATRKDRVEVQAMRCVCAGKATLAEAQHDLESDWRAAYHKYAVMVCPRRSQLAVHRP
jgi:hypothetical protein